MILYLHGLNSGSGSAKAAVLRRALQPVEVLSPGYPAHLAAEAVRVLSDALAQALTKASGRGEPVVLVGSSMGGFYGQYLAQRFPVEHLVMINPALRPWELLKQVVGWQVNEAQGERYYLSREMVAATRRYDLEDVSDAAPTTLLLDQGDELIDWHIAESIYAGRAEIHAFPGGSHAFDHMDEAVAIIRRLHQALSSPSGS